MRKTPIFAVYIIILTIPVIIVSCVNILAGRITVSISKGTQNNYYQVEIYSNKNLQIENTNSFEFNINDNQNIILESGNGRLENGFSSWTSVRQYSKGAYIVVVKIDENGNDLFLPTDGDKYSYKYVVVGEDSDSSVSFSSFDPWYLLQ